MQMDYVEITEAAFPVHVWLFRFCLHVYQMNAMLFNPQHIQNFCVFQMYLETL